MADQHTTPPPAQKAIPLAIAILNNIISGSIKAEEISQDHRQLCVRHMMHLGTYTIYEMTTLLKVSRATIIRDRKTIREGNETAQVAINEEQIADELLEAADYAIAKLNKQGKHKDAWTVRKECVEMMQSMGYIKKAAVNLNVSLVDLLNMEYEQSMTMQQNGEISGNGHKNNGHESTPESDRRPSRM